MRSMFSSEYKGDYRLNPYVAFSRNRKKYCIYCGKSADTREHCPSKTFLKKPYPTNLPVLPSCEHCNNGFSTDELYTKTYIEYAKRINENKESNHIGVDSLRPAEKDAISKLNERLEKFNLNEPDYRIRRILVKLAIGHMVYELSEGYCIIDRDIELSSVEYYFRSSLSEANWKKLDDPELIDDRILPEMGARAYRNIYVLQHMDNKSEDAEGTSNCICTWNIVQENFYKYVAIMNINQITVKLIIMNFLYAKVVFSFQDRNVP